MGGIQGLDFRLNKTNATPGSSREMPLVWSRSFRPIAFTLHPDEKPRPESPSVVSATVADFTGDNQPADPHGR